MKISARMENWMITTDLLLSFDFSSFWDRRFSSSSSFSFLSASCYYCCLFWSFFVIPCVTPIGITPVLTGPVC